MPRASLPSDPVPIPAEPRWSHRHRAHEPSPGARRPRHQGSTRMLRGRPLAVNWHVDRPDHGITRNRHNDVCRSPEAISARADPARRRLHRRRGPRVVRGHRATRGGRREQRSPRTPPRCSPPRWAVASGSCGVRRPSLGGYVTGTGAVAAAPRAAPRPSVADYVIGTGLTDGATAQPEVMDLREFWSNSQIPTLFPHRSPVNSRALSSGEGLLEDEKDTGDSDDVYLEGEASRFRWLRAPATNEIDSGSWLTVVGAADRPYTRK